MEIEEKGVMSEGRSGGEGVKHVERVARENAALFGEGSGSELIVGEKGFEFIEGGRWSLFGWFGRGRLFELLGRGRLFGLFGRG